MMLCQLFLIPCVHAYAFARKLWVHVASAPPTGGGRGPGTSAANYRVRHPSSRYLLSQPVNPRVQISLLAKCERGLTNGHAGVCLTCVKR
jgi:hypothetical protein